MVLSKLDIVVDDLDVVGGEGMGSVGSELSLKYTSKTAVRNACANLVIKTFPNCWLIENATTMSIIRLSYLPSTSPLTLTFLSVTLTHAELGVVDGNRDISQSTEAFRGRVIFSAAYISLFCTVISVGYSDEVLKQTRKKITLN